MLSAFWSGAGEELARHWVARVLTPAFAFWMGGLALVWWHRQAEEVPVNGWLGELAASGDALARLPVLVLGALVVGGLVLVAASAVVAERLTGPLLRLLEGYWTLPRWLWQRMVTHRKKHRDKISERVRELQLRQRRDTLTIPEFVELRRLRTDPMADAKRKEVLEEGAAAGLTAHETIKLGRDLQRLRTTPQRDDLRMPTRLGDALRAAEHRPNVRYGLDAVVCWSALWLVLPADTRGELIATRTALDAAVRGWLWGALFLVWTPFSFWAVLVGVGICLLSYHFGVLPRGVTYGRLIVTAYDLHRMKLYDALYLPRPTSPANERSVAGPRVTKALSGTLDEAGLTYRFDVSA